MGRLYDVTGEQVVTLVSFAFGIASIYIKPCAVASFIVQAIYIALSIYNIVVFIRNGPLLHPIFAIQVSDNVLGNMINRFYAIPINATVITGVFAAFVNPAALIAAVQREHVELTEIEVIFYDFT
ncbi:unnamed protein product [Rotaria magnacalcarata]|uniref:Uncharacterized protein n=1 Tax=Rotaria magnacalcarata TaxID=392030 RepID=A0A815ZIH5_9BILA|nr:unnamed protein product [Rotaria magnacalcarata]CAF1615092.1 unnamed protein product [Rotaria magnacalcarata]CAF2044215.1 unnamed protein product [Rotaria magnacalcarata]CAF2242913.1 unnamed protein product [Rotaria magnacalcarata]CAF4077670.1 unnamed protein product [Rotaria magnacalcarata]